MAAHQLTVGRLREELAKVKDESLVVAIEGDTIMYGVEDPYEYEFMPHAWQPTVGNRYEDLSLLKFEELDG